LGLAVAERLAREGYRVLAVARSSSESLEAAKAQARTEGRGEILHIPFDLSEVGKLSELARTARGLGGGLYGLVNNAGSSAEGLLANMSIAQIETLIRLNTLSPIVLTKFVVRSMMAAGEGRVVNMSSIMADTGYSGLAAYGASKAALVGFTRSLAREVGRLGITVNAVAPGFVVTALTAALGVEDQERIAKRSALGRLAEGADVASAVAYLMSADARNVTGTVMTVDAGATA
jgi:3-oxoacyl-[acyl-carrier protein] reductase